MCYPEKKMFQRMNRVSNLSAQIKLAQFESRGVGLQNFVRIFPCSWELQNYGSAGRGTCGTCGTSRAHIFFCKRRAMG